MKPGESGTGAGPSWRTSTQLLASLTDPGDEESWKGVVDRWWPVLVGYYRKRGLSLENAEEVAQRTFAEFLRAYTGGRYERAKGRLRDWLFGIARNQYASWRRGSHGVPTGFLDPSNECEREGAAPDDDWLREWRLRSMRLCLQRVAAEVDLSTIEAFELFCLRGTPACAVADQLGITENAVYLAKRRVLRRIKDLMNQMEREDGSPGAVNERS